MEIVKSGFLFSLVLFSAAEDCMHSRGENYRGKISITESGHTCQHWPPSFYVGEVEENYCRNPNGFPRPWCYSTDPFNNWEYCSIPQCKECMHGKGEDYRGKISITESGHTCQRWPPSFYVGEVEENYCRNPNGFPRPWCYSTDLFNNWEYCSIPQCKECMHGKGEDYRGKISTTESGHTCQRWPPSFYVGEVEENYCRNPNGFPRPWCYSTDPFNNWEYCSIPQCKECMHGKGEDYRGKISITESGHTCQRWPPSFYVGEVEENYCRNPNGFPRPWCYSTDPFNNWEYCSIPQCKECMHSRGENYRGKISITESGHTCQHWPPSFYVGEVEENYCRNPNGYPRPWCYSTDPFNYWEYCSIPQCKTVPDTIVLEHNCITGDGSSYRGTISVTRSGKTCQRWTSQTPHMHNRTPLNYQSKGLVENYCRNPDGEGMSWCYTTDPGTRWEYCNVPRCENQPRPDDLTCGQPAIEPKRCSGQRIVGGCVSNPHSWPWQISLRKSDKTHKCGGTLIHKQWVLTAAHCLDGSESHNIFAIQLGLTLPTYTIFLGIHTESANEPSKQERGFSKKIMGPSGTDIALLKLDRPAELNDKVSLACLPEKDYMVPLGTECFTTGWGKTLGTGGQGYLKETSIPVIENKICKSASSLYGRVKDHEFCAGLREGGTDSCQGDSGGPLVCYAQNKFVLQGVTLWGDGCADAMKPGVYLRVSKFVDWIEKSIKEN